MSQVTPEYPLKLTIDYPDRNLNRLTSFFRIFAAIPIIIVVILLVGAALGDNSAKESGWHSQGAMVGIVFLPVVLMLLFRQKYPRWWFDWNLALLRFCTRVNAYVFLLRDEYPSTDEEQSVHLEFPYPDAMTLNRWLPLVKWFLAIPHYIVLVVLAIAVLISVIIAWFAILFTGKYPRSLFDFIVGFLRWGLRVDMYALVLITDRYPPFSLS